MIILIDTREQAPLDFSPFPYVTDTERVTLPVGDYSVRYKDNYQPSIIFERKSLIDLFGTLGKGHNRFKKEILKAKELDIKLILVIEGSWSKVIKGIPHSDIAGITIIRKLFMLWVKYGLSFHLCKDREEMAEFIYEYFCSLGRLKGKKDKDNFTPAPIPIPA